MKNQRELENPMVLPRIEYRAPTKVFGHCACGCLTTITEEYAYIRWEDMYFDDRSHLVKFMTQHCELEEIG